MKAQADISVVIPHYNHSDLLPEAVRSCLEQSHPPLEVIIVDDASSPEHLEAAQSLAQTSSKIHLIQNRENQGVVHSINKGLTASQGDYVIFRAADDISLSGSFKASHDILSQHHQASVCFGDVRYFSTSPSNGPLESPALSKAPQFFAPQELADSLTPHHFLSGASTLARRDALIDANGQLPDLHWFADWYCFLTLAFKHGACYVPTPIVGFRLDANSYGNAGTLNLDAKKHAITALLKDLSTGQPEILQRFIDSGSLELFGKPLLLEIIAQTSIVTADVAKRIQQSINSPKLSAATAAQRNIGLPGVIKKALTKAKEQILSTHTNGGHIFLYGAGKHSELLLEIMNAENLPLPHSILTSNQPENSTFQDLPLHSIKSQKIADSDLIILSSKSYESALKETCTKLWPNTPTIPIWLP